jgi:hypothetical protein
MKSMRRRFARGYPVTLLAMLAVTACASDDAPCDCDGQPCVSDADCENGFCAADGEQSPEDGEPLALACRCEIEGREGGDSCRRASDCARGVCLLTGTCADPCDAESDCAGIEACRTVHARTSDAALQPVKACVALSSLPDGGESDNEIKAGFMDGTGSAQLGLSAVKSRALFVLEHLAAEAWPAFTVCRTPVCVEKLETRDAEPTVLFDADLYSRPWQGDEEAPLNPVGTGTVMVANQSHPVAILLPNGPRSVTSDRGYRVEIGWEDRREIETRDLRLTRITNRRPGTLLDLNVFYVGGKEWAPTGDREPPMLKEALRGMEEIYEPVGIGIGEIRQFPVTGKLKDELEFIDIRFGVYAKLQELFSLSAGARGPAVNLFFVRHIQEAMAISGGTPGPMGMHGTGGSGIAVSTDKFDDADTLAKVIAHELGHYLGLFHPVELEGFVLDPLPDTPECRLDNDTNENGYLDPNECVGIGAGNLMFPVMSGGTTITDDQAEVLRSAAILR